MKADEDVAEDEARELLMKICQCKDNKFKLYSKSYLVTTEEF